MPKEFAGVKLKRSSKGAGELKKFIETGQKTMKKNKRSDRYSIRQKHRDIQPDVKGKKQLPRGDYLVKLE